MTRATRSKLEKKGKVPPLPPEPAKVKRLFSPEEILQLQQMNMLVNSQRFISSLVKGNTALVPDGQKLASQYEAVAMLVENGKNAWVASTLLACGYPYNMKCHINMSTGEITEDKS